MREVRVVIVQTVHDEDDPAENVAEMIKAVERYKDADIVVFPELTLHGHHVAGASHAHQRQALKATSDEDVDRLHDLISRSRAAAVFGALLERDGRLQNLAMYCDGDRCTQYAKTHVHWSENFDPGDDLPVFETRLGRTGMLICFDAAFGEVPRVMALKGAETIVNISAIPASFPLEVVHRRIQACSVQNQVWTIFANRRGDGYAGGSAIADPLGELVAVAGPEDEALDARIDLNLVHRWREMEPLLLHRRPSLYKMISNSTDESQTPK